jgi:metal-responsive CopG/Arc/MetJ family transcriptional regulator
MKKKNFGITLNPEIYKLLDLKAEQEGKSRSQLIEEIMEEHFKNKNKKDD